MKRLFSKVVASLALAGGLTQAQEPHAPTTHPGTIIGAPTYGEPVHSIAPEGCTTCGGSGSWEDYGHDDYQYWFSAEYLLWNIEDDRLPRVATNVPVGIATSGVAVPPGQVVPVFSASAGVLPNGNLDLGDSNGVRLGGGMWLNEEHTCGLEVSAFALEDNGQGFAFATSSTGVPAGGLLLGSTLSTAPLTLIAAQSQSTVFGTSSNDLWGIEANARFWHLGIGPVTFSALSGARFIDFDENLSVVSSATLAPLPGATPFPINAGVGTVAINGFDNISVSNQFYGGQIGFDVDSQVGAFFISARGQVGIGAMRQVVRGLSNTAVTLDGVAQPSTVGGAIVGRLDQGENSRTRVAVVPQVTVKAGYSFNNTLRVFVSYDALYLDNVVRPGSVVGAVNAGSTLTTLGGAGVAASQSALQFNETHVWIRGIGFGAELRY